MNTFRTYLAITALAAALFMGTGLCPMCTFGSCNKCDMPAPEPKPVAEAHSCCSKETPSVTDFNNSDESTQCSTGKCEGDCIKLGADTEPLPVQTFELRIENGTNSVTVNNDSCVALMSNAIEADHTDDLPPPSLHESIYSTILII